MTDPFRLRVLKAVSAAIAEVTVANGYEHTLTDAVFRGRTEFGEGDPLPMASILEDPRALEQLAPAEGAKENKGEWNLLVQGFVQDDPDNPTDPAHHMMADVKKALVKQRLDPLNILGLGYKMPAVTGLRLGAGVVRPADNLSAKAYFWLPLTLTLVEDLENPFT